MIKKIFFISILSTAASLASYAQKIIRVGKNQTIASIRQAIKMAKDKDTILVYPGLYREGNILINKKIVLIGKGFPVIDANKKSDAITIAANEVSIAGFKIINSSYSSLEDPAAIRIYGASNVTARNNILEDNFFGIYLQNATKCLIEKNIIRASLTREAFSGNGIHCWKSSDLVISKNDIRGHRDGIYFEFVDNSTVRGNVSSDNIRYGLHFMFSNRDTYTKNIFRNNGAGIAVMFSHYINMTENLFQRNWGAASYGLLLKEIYDGVISKNIFDNNTSGIYIDGSNRVRITKNIFKNNGWAIRTQANCQNNAINKNNFLGNTFDIATNGDLTLSNFDSNYWDKYKGYDLDKDGYGDAPFHPLSLFAILVEKAPPLMILLRSFMVTLLDESEKILPTITPDIFADRTPLMRQLDL